MDLKNLSKEELTGKLRFQHHNTTDAIETELLRRLTLTVTGEIGELLDQVGFHAMLGVEEIIATGKTPVVSVYLTQLRHAIAVEQGKITMLRELIAELVEPKGIDGDVIYPECDNNNAPICVWCGSEYYDNSCKCTRPTCPAVRARAAIEVKG